MNSYLDDATLERLNALAIEPQPAAPAGPSPRRALDSALFELMTAQEEGSRWKAKVAGSVVATDRWLIDRSLPEVAAIVDTGTIVERAAALVRLVACTGQPWAARRPEWQGLLSHLLVRYPVLMDHRLAFCGFTDLFEWAPLPHLLACSAFGSLPRLSHGIGEAALRRFASLQCVKNGLTRIAPGPRRAGASAGGRTVASIAFGDAVEAASGFPLRGQMIVSLMELTALARQETGKAFFGKEPEQREVLQNHLGKIFWDVAAAGGRASGMSGADFADAVSLLSKAAPWLTPTDILANSISAHLDRGLEPATVRTAPSEDYKVAAVRHAIELLVEIGAESDARTAAQWLSRQFVGISRRSDGVAPKWHPREILAVLEELWRHQVRITLTGADTRGALADKELFITWRDAIALHGRAADMQALIAARASAADAAQDLPATSAPLRRRKAAL